MYSFENIDGKELNKESVLERVTEEMLWRHYLGFSFQVGRTYKSPLRDDPTPSFSIYDASRKGKIQAKDHGGTFSGDVLDFIGVLHGLDFYGVLVKVNLDFGLGLSYNRNRQIGNIQQQRVVAVPRIVVNRAASVTYEVVQRPPLQADYDYWLSHGITRDTLRLYEVRCVNILYCNGQCCYTYSPGDPCYQYRFRSGNSKFYRPFAEKTLKFRGNIDNLKDVQGFYQCSVAEPRESRAIGDLLVLTKSLKDVMLLQEHGIDAMAIHGEKHKFDPLFMAKLKRSYMRILSMYDRDASGMCGARYLWREYGIDWVFIPKGDGKDITDMFRLKGKLKVDEFVEKRIRH